MLRQSRSATEGRNLALMEQPRQARENNLLWGARAVEEMGIKEPERWSYLVLLGGDDLNAFRLRVAQSQLRSDMLPSYWSEVILAKLAGSTLEGATALHVPLMQPAHPHFPGAVNGVVEGPLSEFKDQRRYPNIAVIALPTPQERILKRIEDFKLNRPTLDALEHVVRWLAFCWGSARTPNPLSENFGMPSACMLEIVCGAEGFDLTPGLEARASCPEAIWAAAKYWTQYYQKTTEGNRSPQGRYWTPHHYAIFESAAKRESD